MPRDGGFLREIAARDKTGSQQAGDLYLPVLGAGSHLRRFRVRHSREAKLWYTEGKDNVVTSSEGPASSNSALEQTAGFAYKRSRELTLKTSPARARSWRHTRISSAHTRRLPTREP